MANINTKRNREKHIKEAYELYLEKLKTSQYIEWIKIPVKFRNSDSPYYYNYTAKVKDMPTEYSFHYIFNHALDKLKEELKTNKNEVFGQMRVNIRSKINTNRIAETEIIDFTKL